MLGFKEFKTLRGRVVRRKSQKTPQVIKREINLGLYKRKKNQEVVGNKMMAKLQVHKEISLEFRKIFGKKRKKEEEIKKKVPKTKAKEKGFEKKNE